MSEELEHQNRRQFIKSVGAFSILGASVSAQEASVYPTKPGYVIPQFVDMAIKEYHICQGLNMTADGDIRAGAADKTNLIANELHSCEGGNSCAGLGACGTGVYARQYWIADNRCAKEATVKDQNPKDIPWNGTGGCGVPIGTGNTGYVSSQLNGAAPGKDANGDSYPGDFVGQPVWNIARARFEAKMVKNKKPFGIPAGLDKQTDLHAATWDGVSEYVPNPKSPPPYPTPFPARDKPLHEQKKKHKKEQ